MTSRIASSLRIRRAGVAIALSLTALGTAVSASTPAQAAPNVLISLDCRDERNTFRAHAALDGSGAPTAKYEVQITLYDYIDDTRAPMARLISLNKDGSVTNYPWRTGAQGRNVISTFDTTLQQPKGLDGIVLEAKTDRDSSLFYCTDWAPK